MKRTNPLADILLETVDGESCAEYTIRDVNNALPFNSKRIIRAALQTLASDDRLPAEQRDQARQELDKLFPDRGVLIDSEPKTRMTVHEWDAQFAP